ncbi:hypothetical protein RvY_02125 [Ramazzottius varieornatus]|uniref:MAM domain-containing protein n=1 Tax=Ramazzottius varieornatus TaxID=947166 RepID=A0A1D1UJH1_RAMVA|nr:hypothetical protein RvY_02125 [Ramazzottius varieornatus]
MIDSFWNCLVRYISLLLLAVSSSTISGEITCTFEDHFCGWFPFADNSSWRRWNSSHLLIATNGVRPPQGALSMAYVISSTESWAEMLSEPLGLTNVSMLTFDVIQTRFGFATNMPQVTLWTVNSNGSYDTLLWASDIIPRWKSKEFFLMPSSNGQKLLFQFRVGFSGQTAALSNIILQPLLNQTILDLVKARNETLVKDSEMANRTAMMNTHVYSRGNVTQDGKGDGVVSCTFALGLCGWKALEGSGEPSTASSPFSRWVRTNNGGHPFLAINISKRSPDEWFVEFRGNTTMAPSNKTIAPMLSVSFHNAVKWRNISFLYLRKGDLQSSVHFVLTASTPKQSGNSTSTVLWKAKEPEKKNYVKWTLAHVPIPYDGNVKLELACNANMYTICAVDNIVLEDEEVTKIIKSPQTVGEGAVLRSQNYVTHYSGSTSLQKNLLSGLCVLNWLVFHLSALL